MNSLSIHVTTTLLLTYLLTYLLSVRKQSSKFEGYLRVDGLMTAVNIENVRCNTGETCCASQLIDSSRERVVLETSRAIDDGTYEAVRLRLCSTDDVSVQLWRQVDSTTYQLRWRMTLNPTTRQTSVSYITVVHSPRSVVTL